MDRWLFVLTLVSAGGSWLIAGVFFAFSNFVMRALDRLPFGEGIAAMQSINRTVLNPLFLGLFVGTAGLCFVLVVVTLFRWPEPGASYRVAGSLLYIAGTFLVTAALNVPLNEKLARLDPNSVEASGAWSEYVTRWTRWNHVRTVAAMLAALALTISLA